MNQRLSSWIVLVGLTALGCGGNSGTGKNLNNFLGNYTTAGTIAISGAGACSTVGTYPTSGPGKFVAGSSSDLLWQSQTPGDCTNIPANINGATSFAIVKTTCTQGPDPSGTTITFDLNGNGSVSNNALSVNLSGNATLTDRSGSSLTCQYTWSISGNKY